MCCTTSLGEATEIGQTRTCSFNQAGIFGTTRGLVSGDTTVFRLTPSGNGWTNTVLLDYGVDGSLYGGVISGPDGSLYGTRFEGGQNYGYVFQFSVLINLL